MGVLRHGTGRFRQIFINTLYIMKHETSSFTDRLIFPSNLLVLQSDLLSYFIFEHYENIWLYCCQNMNHNMTRFVMFFVHSLYTLAPILDKLTGAPLICL